MTPLAATEVGRLQVSRLVHAFYADVRADALLGPVFARPMHCNWPDHLELMADFWCTALKLERSFRGNVCGRHVVLSGVTRDPLLRWLLLWRERASEQLPQAEAGRVQGIAVGMARMRHLGWFDALPTRQELCAGVDAAASAQPLSAQASSAPSGRRAGLPVRTNCGYATGP